LSVYRLLLRRGTRWLTSTTGTSDFGVRAAPAGRGIGRPSFGAIALFGVFTAYLVIPIVAVVLYSVAARWVGTVLPEALTLDKWAEVLGSSRIVGAFTTSLWLGVVTTVVVLLLAVPAVYWSQVRNPRLRPLLQFAAAIPFALPFVVVGFALLSFAGVVLPQIQGTMTLVILAYVSVSFSFVYWALDGAMTAADVRRLTEAAAACGASPLQALRRVVLPNIRSGVVTAAILAFALGIGEFALVKVLAGSLNTIPLWTARTMEASGGTLGPVAVVTTIVFVMLFVLSALIAYVNRSRASGEMAGVGELGSAGQA
jgi:putative spermidine/putrescine transport system permease protein